MFARNSTPSFSFRRCLIFAAAALAGGVALAPPAFAAPPVPAGTIRMGEVGNAESLGSARERGARPGSSIEAKAVRISVAPTRPRPWEVTAGTGWRQLNYEFHQSPVPASVTVFK